MRRRIESNGAAGLSEKTAPNGNTAEVIGLKHRMSVSGINGVSGGRGGGNAGSRQENAKCGVVHRDPSDWKFLFSFGAACGSALRRLAKSGGTATPPHASRRGKCLRTTELRELTAKHH